MENTSLNLNTSRSDKFSFILSNIPSLDFINEINPDELERNMELKEGYDNFMLGIAGVELPGISHGEEKIGTMFSPVSVESQTVEFDPLTTEIRVDSNYYVYKLLYAWMMAIKNPFGMNNRYIREIETDLFVDGTISVNDNMENKSLINFEFTDLRPITLPSLSLDYTTNDELTLSVTWAYTSFDVTNNRGEPLLKINGER